MAKEGDRRKSFWSEEEETSPKRRSTDRLTEEAEILQQTAVLDQKIHDAKVLMEQTNQLYQHYFNGIEKRPPIEKALLLETRIKELERFNDGVAVSKFKVNQFVLQYKTMRELWDRKLRDKEIR